MSVSLGTEFRRGRIALWFVAGFLFLALLFVTWQYVGTVVLGLFVYYVTRPVFDRIHGRIEGRTTAVVVSILAVALPVLLLTAWAGVVAVQGLVELVSSQGFDEFRGFLDPYLNVAELRDQFRDVFDVVVEDPGRLTAIGGGGLGDVFGTLVGSVVLLFNVFIQLFIVLVITFYLLRDDHRIAAWADDTFAPEGGVLDAYFVAVDRDLKNVYFGNILNALVTGLLGAVVYSILNVVAPPAVQIPEPVLLGLLTGAASLIPVIGMKLVWVPIALVLLVDSLVTDPTTVWFPAVFAVVSTVVVDYIPDQLLRPYVSGRTLHVGAVMIAYVVGPLLFGWYGIFLGPLVLVVIYEFARVVVPWLAHPEREGVPTPDPGGEPSDRRSRTRRAIAGSVPTGMITSGEERDPGPSEDRTDD